MLCEKTHTQLPLGGSEDSSEENPSLPENKTLSESMALKEGVRESTARMREWRRSNPERDKANRLRRMAALRDDPIRWEAFVLRRRSQENGRYARRIAKLLKTPDKLRAFLEKERRRSATKRLIYPRPKSIKPKRKAMPRDERLARARAYNMRPDVKQRRAEYYKNRKAAEPGYREACNAAGVARFHKLKPEIYAYRNHRRKTNPQFQISSNLRTYIYQRVGKKNTTGQSRFRQIVGCTIAEFCAHLERNFGLGMNWQNYGKGVGRWGIDHTKPCASFDLTKPEELALCFHFSNMLPMWWIDSLRKGDKIPCPSPAA